MPSLSKSRHSMHPLIAFPLWLLFLCATVAGCSSLKDYTSGAPRNLTIDAEADSGSWFAKTTVDLHIYRMKGGCALDYLGTIELKDRSVMTGLEIGQKVYLKFNITTDNSVIEYATIITPRPGAQYKALAKYANRMYEVRVREVDARGTVREFERQQFNCPET